MRSVKSSDSIWSVNSAAYLSRIPDVILPSQFFESVGAKTFSSEQRLMLAILADAINILRAYRVSPSRVQRDFNEASSWVFADGIESSLSFDHVCDALGLNAENLRRRLSVWILGNNLRRLRLNETGRKSGPTLKRAPRR